LAVAGIQQYVASTGARGQTFVAIDSGANINFATLAEVAKRLEPSL
jgi:threonine dehydratase